MIENYNPNVNNAVHTIRITLMQFDYVGHIAYKISGNCKGASLLDAESIFECATQNEIDNYVENDCELALDEDYEIYTGVLTNASGDKWEFQYTPNEMADTIVAVEFVKVEEGKEKK